MKFIAVRIASESVGDDTIEIINAKHISRIARGEDINEKSTITLFIKNRHFHFYPLHVYGSLSDFIRLLESRLPLLSLN